MIDGQQPVATTVADAWTSCPGPDCPAGAVRLLCLPYAGGGANAYRPWAQLLQPEVELWLAHLPGRERRIREAPIHSLQTLVRELDSALAGHGVPIALFGHSFGAVVAYELACRLAAMGRGPSGLVVSGQPAPNRVRAQGLSELPDEELVEAVRGLGGTPEEVLLHPELMEMMLPVIRADMAAYDSWRPQADEPAALACPVVAYRGLQDPRTPEGSMAGWARVTTGAFRERVFDGDHFFVTARSTEVCAALVADVGARA
jgi:medium-chain acyl-[acyl-carrier-protein] hydrolase